MINQRVLELSVDCRVKSSNSSAFLIASEQCAVTHLGDYSDEESCNLGVITTLKRSQTGLWWILSSDTCLRGRGRESDSPLGLCIEERERA